MDQCVGLRRAWNDCRADLFQTLGSRGANDRAAEGFKEMNMRALTTTLAAMALAAAWFGPVPGARAQGQSPPASPGSQPSTAISDQKLDKTAAAIQRVTAVTHDYQQKMAQADPSDKERLASEANGALVKAVTDQGLSVDEYNSILRVAQNDPTLKAKIMQRLNGAPQ
jgi:Domain of unknown function (DUF4168)